MVEYIPDCPFMKNSSVGCSLADRHCDTCGWNPVVDAARRQKIREEFLKEVANDKN